MAPPWHDQLGGVDFTVDSLYGALAQRCSVVVTRVEDVLGAEILRAPLAKRLGVDAGRAILITERRSFDQDGEPVVHDRVAILDERMRVTTKRQLVGNTMSWDYRDGSR